MNGWTYIISNAVEHRRATQVHGDAQGPVVSKSSMSFFITNHRPDDVTGCDFGFEKPITHRLLTRSLISPDMTLVHSPPYSENKDGSSNDWAIMMEKHNIATPLGNPE